jgi:hypothetical protein
VRQSLSSNFLIKGSVRKGVEIALRYTCMHTYIHTYIHTYRQTYIYRADVDVVGLLVLGAEILPGDADALRAQAS